MDRYTNGDYRAKNPDWHAGDAPHKAKAIVQLVRDVGWKPAFVGEAGCGSGQVLQRVCAALGARGHGVDPSKEALRQAPQNPQIQFEQGGVDALPACDMVMGIDVVEHVADDIGFVRAMAAKSDHIVLRIPLDVSALDSVRPARMLEARRRFGHRSVYTVDLALALVQDAGLQVVTHRTDRVPVRAASRIGRVSDKARRVLHFLAPEATTRWLGGYSLLIACTP